MRWDFVAIGAAMFATVGCGGSAAKSDGGLPVAGAAVTYQIDVAHTGHQPSTALRPPLTKRWSVDLGGAVSYPVIVGGRVFVTVGDDTNYQGGKLHALDLATGAPSWGPIDIPGTQMWLNAAYDQGRIYVLNFDGRLAAFDAQSGTSLWAETLPVQYAFMSPPAATAGMVFVDGAGSGNTVYGIDGATGAVKWSRDENGGEHASPAVSADAVFVVHGCLTVDALSPLDGSRIWLHLGSCLGGPGITAALYDARLWTRDHFGINQALDVTTGEERGEFAAGPIPAFHDRRGFFVVGGALEARDIDSGAVTWSFSGDGTLVTAPIVANGAVYVGGSSGNIYAVDETTGTTQWSDAIGEPIPEPTEFTPHPMNGLAVGSDSLLVPTSHRLVCYQ